LRDFLSAPEVSWYAPRASYKAKSIWDGIVEKMERWLSSW